MFVYARMKGAYCRDDKNGCQCYCETKAEDDGTCVTKDAKNWDLYSLVIDNQSKCDWFLYNYEDDACFVVHSNTCFGITMSNSTNELGFEWFVNANDKNKAFMETNSSLTFLSLILVFMEKADTKCFELIDHLTNDIALS